jgi:hypothetical protein
MTRARRRLGSVVPLLGLCLGAPDAALAQVTAEAANPKGDMWFGGTGDPWRRAPAST